MDYLVLHSQKTATSMKYLEIIKSSYQDYWNYLHYELVSLNHWDNYFYGLIAISMAVWLLEIIFPWRKQQAIIRKDFWLDLMYMFFNFFLLNLIVLMALSNTASEILNDFFGLFGVSLIEIQIMDINTLPYGLGLIVFFVLTDFIQWNTHKLLHRVPFLWHFHKVHHSAKEMGFATHFRYHWAEPVVYKSILYIPVAIIGGFGARDLALVHFFTICIGHLNHSNLGWDYGILKYIFNNPKMHVWHHAKYLPKDRTSGVNFGITLSIWDYMFNSSYVPHAGEKIQLGFQDDEGFPRDFLYQLTFPFIKKKN